jgi:hypothetical protein
MESVRSFFRSNSSRSSKENLDLIVQYARKHSISTGINDLKVENDDNKSSSSELSRENIKSFFLAHPSSVAVIRQNPKLRFKLDKCSGLSIEENPIDAIIAASAFASTANFHSFTDHSSPKRRHFSIPNNELTRSWIAEQNLHHRKNSLSPEFRRTKSHRYPSRIRRHSIKRKHSNGHLTRRHSQVNRSLNTNITT